MRPITARYLASLGLARYVTRVEWSLGGVDWHECVFAGGDVKADASSQVRWSCSLTLSGVEIGKAALSPFGTQLRVFSGMVLDVDDVEWVPLGVYRVKTVHRSGVLRDGAPSLVEVTGQSLESVVIADRFTTPHTFRSQDGRDLLVRLIHDSLPDASVQWRIEDTTLVPDLIVERERWAIIDGDRDAKSIARALGGRVYCDGRGVFVAAPTPSLQDTPVWTLDVGDGGVLVEPSEDLSDEGVYNVVVASGAAEETGSDGKSVPPVGPAIIEDGDPSSPTYVGGPFGHVPRFYSSPLLRSQGMCAKAAASLLAQNLGLRQTVTLQTVVNFALEVGDVVQARMPDGSMASHVIDSITYPLGGGVMDLSTRATATRFAGQPTDAPEDTGDVDESGAGDE